MGGCTMCDAIHADPNPRDPARGADMLVAADPVAERLMAPVQATVESPSARPSS